MKAHCPRGHEMTGENVYVNKSDGIRRCRECRKLNSINYALRKNINRQIKKSSGTTGAWSKGELQTLSRMMAEGKTPDEIAQELGCSALRVKSRLVRERMTEEQRAAQAQRKKEWIKKNTVDYRHCSENRASSRPPPDLIEDAQRRSLAPRSITSMLCGDPPKGYSALDRRATQ